VHVRGSGGGPEAGLIRDVAYESQRRFNARVDADPAEQLCSASRDVGNDVRPASAAPIGAGRDRYERDRRISVERENGSRQQVGQRTLDGEAINADRSTPS
jgi:hypothetical protein